MFEEDENGSFSHRRAEFGAQSVTGADWLWLVLVGSGRFWLVVGSGWFSSHQRKKAGNSGWVLQS